MTKMIYKINKWKLKGIFGEVQWRQTVTLYKMIDLH